MPKKPKKTLRWRLALDLGTTSLGWAMLRLNKDGQPCDIVRAGVRIFSTSPKGAGRDPEKGTSLAVTRRNARAMRRRRDRLLRRKVRMMQQLIDLGFFPQDAVERKRLELKNPYELRARGLDTALAPGEFARALFHLCQRRGFQSNRRTDKGAEEKEAGALKAAIKELRERMEQEHARTVGEWLWKQKKGKNVRARPTAMSGSTVTGYDLYMDREMIAAEFDALWAKQAALNPQLFTEDKRAALRDTLLHQRPLRPVAPGRCTLEPEEKRAPRALPVAQRFRVLQDINHLRVSSSALCVVDAPLTQMQRDALLAELEEGKDVTFTSLRGRRGQKLGLPSDAQFNLEGRRNKKLKGNEVSALLAKEKYFGARWHNFPLELKDEIVWRLLAEDVKDSESKQQSEAREKNLMQWLCEKTGVDRECAKAMLDAPLKTGHLHLSRKALERIVPKLQELVPDAAGNLRPRTYDEAVRAAGFESHSVVDVFDFDHAAGDVQELVNSETGEIMRVLRALPYYGRVLHRHVAFGSGNPQDSEEKRYGKIANPTVHIGLNQTRKVVNALVQRYGHPAEIIVEVARELKQGYEERKRAEWQQAENQKRNERIRSDIAKILGISESLVSRDDIQKWILWEELNPNNCCDRRCPYSGAQISAAMLLSGKVEVEHILPFSKTLDNSLNNRTVCIRRANRIKGNRTPWEARKDFAREGWEGWSYDGVLQRAAAMPPGKRWRFAEGAYQRWLREDQDFLARALNDTRYLSRLARMYLQPICRGNVRVIPGQMTALLRAKFGLNRILNAEGKSEKNRDDHRHHAVDACVIGVTDQGLLRLFAEASASAREKALDRLVETMPQPWEGYYQSVQRAVDVIWVSHKPDRSHEGQMLKETSYGFHGAKAITSKIGADGVRERTEKERDAVVPIANQKAPHATNRPWHGSAHYQQGTEYKGYLGGSNWCMEIVRDEEGKWKGEIISTFQAYKLARTFAAQFRAKHGSNAQVPPLAEMMSATHAVSGKPLVMRLMKGDMVKMAPDGGEEKVMRMYGIRSDGKMVFAPHEQANVDARDRDKEDDFKYTTKYAGSLQKAKGRRVSISPIGKLHDPGFKN